MADLERRVADAERKAERAVITALGAVETIKHMQRAAEHAHAQQAEQLAAMRKMLGIVEALSSHVLGDAKGGE
jgi:hypothetical protein